MKQPTVLFVIVLFVCFAAAAIAMPGEYEEDIKLIRKACGDISKVNCTRRVRECYRIQTGACHLGLSDREIYECAVQCNLTLEEVISTQRDPDFFNYIDFTFPATLTVDETKQREMNMCLGTKNGIVTEKGSLDPERLRTLERMRLSTALENEPILKDVMLKAVDSCPVNSVEEVGSWLVA